MSAIMMNIDYRCFFLPDAWPIDFWKPAGAPREDVADRVRLMDELLILIGLSNL